MDGANFAASTESPTHHTPLPETRWSRRIDGALRRLGEATGWIWLALLVVIVTNVLLRYLFGEGRIELEELQWHLYAVGFLVAIATGIEADAHVRVDFLHERLSPRSQAWIELYGLLLLSLPFAALVIFYTVPFVAWAWQSGEVSSAPGGLPHRFLIKGALLAGFAGIGLAAFSRLLRVSAFLFGAPTPLAPATSEGSDAEPRG